MTAVPPPQPTRDERIDRWRAHLTTRPGLTPGDAQRLEVRLREHLDALSGAALTDEEAFLVAEHRLRADVPFPSARWRTASLVPLLFAMAAGLAIKVPVDLVTAKIAGQEVMIGAALLGLAVVVTAFFAWLRRPPVAPVLAVNAAAVGVVALTQALYPSVDPHHTRSLATLHLPIALAVLLGTAYLGRDWWRTGRWLGYLRHLGEAMVFLALIALGGGVLTGLTAAVVSLIGISPEVLLGQWVMPLGLGGAVIVALWLAESKRTIAENLAPVLAAVFTPLFALLLVGFLVAMVVTGRIVDIDRDALIVVDLLLVVVLGLHLFSYAARPPQRPAGLSDWLQLTLVTSALVIDVIVLAAIAGRIGEYGSTPNKLAALGENIVVAGILAGSLWLMVGFLTGRRPLSTLHDWHCRALWVIGGWAAVVVLLVPVAFGFR